MMINVVEVKSERESGLLRQSFKTETIPEVIGVS